ISIPWLFHLATKNVRGTSPVFTSPCITHGDTCSTSPLAAGNSLPSRCHRPEPSVMTRYSSSACRCAGCTDSPGLTTATAARAQVVPRVSPRKYVRISPQLDTFGRASDHVTTPEPICPGGVLSPDQAGNVSQAPNATATIGV